MYEVDCSSIAAPRPRHQLVILKKAANFHVISLVCQTCHQITGHKHCIDLTAARAFEPGVYFP